MVEGTLVNLPHSGGIWEQYEPDMVRCTEVDRVIHYTVEKVSLLHLISIARNAWVIFKYMPDHKMKWKHEHADFIDWVNNG